MKTILLPLLLALFGICSFASGNPVYNDALARFADYLDTLDDDEIVAIDAEKVYASAYHHFRIRWPESDSREQARKLSDAFVSWRADWVAKARRQARRAAANRLARQSPPPAPAASREIPVYSGDRKSGSGTITGPTGVRNYWTNKDGSVQIAGPEGLTTIYPAKK
jgi:hypothetical protein